MGICKMFRHSKNGIYNRGIQREKRMKKGSYGLLWINRFILCLLFFWIGGGAYFGAYVSLLAVPLLEKTHGIVVFTGERGRVAEALRLYQKGWAPLLHISGGKPPLSFPTITFDDAATTAENVIFTAFWIRKNRLTSVRLITSDYHMPRCLLYAQRAWPTTIVPHPLHLSLGSRFRLFRIFREYNKWLWTLTTHLLKIA